LAATVEEPRKQRTARVDWAWLLRRTFAWDVFACYLFLKPCKEKISSIVSMAHLPQENLLAMLG
jgi:hypothetical protein